MHNRKLIILLKRTEKKINIIKEQV